VRLTLQQADPPGELWTIGNSDESPIGGDDMSVVVQGNRKVHAVVNRMAKFHPQGKRLLDVPLDRD